MITDDRAALLRRMWPVYARGIKRLFVEQLGDDSESLRTTLERVAERARRP